MKINITNAERTTARTTQMTIASQVDHEWKKDMKP